MYYFVDSGIPHYFKVQDVMDDVMYRQAAPRRRDEQGTPRRRRRVRPGGIMVHQPPFQPPVYAPTPYGQPVPYYGPAAPMPAPAPAQESQGLDMRTALDAIGTLLPAVGKMIAAFRHPPERPKLTGQPDKDLDSVLDYVAENFDHARSGAQTAGVLATTGAVLEILASL